MSPSLAPSTAVFLTRSESSTPSSQHCPATTVTPDANGWVPPGTCGYLSRPYYPSFLAALLFSAAAAAVLAGFVLVGVRAGRSHQERLREKSAPSWKDYILPWCGVLLAACLLAAYVLRALGTRHMQVAEFVAVSDTLVLMCPLCVSPTYSFFFSCRLPEN